MERIPLIHIENFKNAVIKVVEANLNDRIFFVVDDEQPSRKYLNEVLLKSGIIRYKPLYIGKKGFYIYTTIKQLFALILNKPYLNKDFIRASIAFRTRRLTYDCNLLKSRTGWESKIKLFDTFIIH